MQEKHSTSLQVLLGLGILYTLYLAHAIILPIVLAFMVSLLLSPLVIKAWKRWRLPKPVSALTLLFILVLAMGGLVTSIAAPALEWAEKAPQSISRVLVGENELRSQLDKLTESARQLEESMEEFSDEQAQTVILQTESWRNQLARNAQKTLVGLALALALTYFFLVSGDRLIFNWVRQTPRKSRRTLLNIVRASQQQMARYLGVITLTNFSIGLTMGLVCWALGLPTPALWGVVAGLARFIPYLGVMSAAALLAVVSATHFGALGWMLIAPLTYIALTGFVGAVIEPYIHGFRMAVNPIVIFLSIFFWGWLWGPVGFFLAVPLMTVIQVVLSQIPQLKPVHRIISR
ncbi:Predicted PurR-regulated permease PerM [Marinospirillum celere]|uniref:Predicted PurR-regulated permease PerM n=1 Tax=Marinospirillum celere TaxID=1122252 RepID=A0A1I1JHW4_9GAMM|nr:AI-2E family transporter [Marinospirillum celere]SFC48219.1 Predicted PurR-regulated permease PerM [Marinospirillum celere]